MHQLGPRLVFGGLSQTLADQTHDLVGASRSIAFDLATRALQGHNPDVFYPRGRPRTSARAQAVVRLERQGVVR